MLLQTEYKIFLKYICFIFIFNYIISIPDGQAGVDSLQIGGDTKQHQQHQDQAQQQPDQQVCRDKIQLKLALAGAHQVGHRGVAAAAAGQQGPQGEGPVGEEGHSHGRHQDLPGQLPGLQ